MNLNKFRYLVMATILLLPLSAVALRCAPSITVDSPLNPNFRPAAISVDPVLSGASVSPVNPHHNTGVDITFKVTYTDADNDTPSYVRLIVFNVAKTDFGAYQISSNKVDPLDNDYTDGVEYFYTIQEGSAGDIFGGVGIHEYFFKCSDDGGSTEILLPSSGYFTDFEIIDIDPVLSNPSVTSPVYDGSGDDITFNVTYTHADNIAPSYVRLIVFNVAKTDFGAYQISSNKVDPSDNDYTDGVEYFYTISEGSAGDIFGGVGVHEYFFKCSDDGSTEILLPSSGNFLDFEILESLSELNGVSVITALLVVMFPIMAIAVRTRRKSE